MDQVATQSSRAAGPFFVEIGELVAETIKCGTRQGFSSYLALELRATRMGRTPVSTVTLAQGANYCTAAAQTLAVRPGARPETTPP